MGNCAQTKNSNKSKSKISRKISFNLKSVASDPTAKTSGLISVGSNPYSTGPVADKKSAKIFLTPKASDQSKAFFRTPNGRKKTAAQNFLRSKETSEEYKTNQIKSENDYQIIRKAIESIILLNSLPKMILELVISEMSLYFLHKNDILFSQDEYGNTLFIVASGKLGLFADEVSKGSLKRGQYIGEIALMHSFKHGVTVKALENSLLWGIDRKNFRLVIESISTSIYNDNKNLIENSQIFRQLTISQKEKILDIIITQEFSDGEIIVNEGDLSEFIYIIKEGTAICKKNNIDIKELKRGDYFGEQSLLYKTKKTMCVVSKGKAKILCLSRSDIYRVLGDFLQKILHKNCIKKAIKRNEILQQLSEDQICAIINKVKTKNYMKDENLSISSEKGPRLLFILNGSIKSIHTDSEFIQGQCIGDREMLNPEQINDDEYISTASTDIAELTISEFQECIGGSLENVINQNDVIKVLKNVALFDPIPNHKLEQLVSVIKICAFRDKQSLYLEGAEADCFFIVIAGRVDILKGEGKVNTFKTGHLFGVEVFNLDKHRTQSAISHGNSTVYSIEYQEFIDTISENLHKVIKKYTQLHIEDFNLRNFYVIKSLSNNKHTHLFLVVQKYTKQLYTLKITEKSRVFNHNISEKLLLLRYPLLSNILAHKEDEERIYQLEEFVKGSDLYEILKEVGPFSNKTAKFYAACIILIIEKLHELGIMHRDYKPENIMIDEDGYPKLIDFNAAKIINGRTYTVIGTPHYMAPEVILGIGYNFSAEYWSLGTIIYEFLYGKLPFGENYDDPYSIYQQILQNSLVFPDSPRIKSEVRHLISQLLSKNPALRKNHESLKLHPWFHSIDWEELSDRSLSSPYNPPSHNMYSEIAEAIRNKEDPLYVMMLKN
ncbi:unnamed protein product [Blepharisma stoltei]|uniref:cGMP-dependent protein kinase n=1 Tax=Blepharisma stoltei TaxID=1481888 RepID=A0AAU9J9E9_9CILI|nr:unnamed protein product [Blepharisma stoltei]